MAFYTHFCLVCQVEWAFDCPMADYADATREHPVCGVVASNRVYEPVQIARGAIKFEAGYIPDLGGEIRTDRQFKEGLARTGLAVPEREARYRSRLREIEREKQHKEAKRQQIIDSVIASAKAKDKDGEMTPEVEREARIMHRQLIDKVEKDPRMLPKPKGAWTDLPEHLRGQVITEDVSRAKAGLP